MGRDVRCAKCGETWFVQPASSSVMSATDPDALALADDLGPDADLKTHTEPSQGEDRVEASSGVESVPDSAALMSAPIQSIGADALMRDLADAKKLAGRRRTIRIIWFVALLLVIAAAIIAWFNRQEIVNRYPQTAGLYQAIGVEIRKGGLELDPPLAKTVIEDGARLLRVESRIRNLTGDALPIPLIELTLHDDAGRDLAQWYVETQPRIIAPRAVLPFSTDYADPPEGGAGVRYRLAYDNG